MGSNSKSGVFNKDRPRYLKYTSFMDSSNNGSGSSSSNGIKQEDIKQEDIKQEDIKREGSISPPPYSSNPINPNQPQPASEQQEAGNQTISWYSVNYGKFYFVNDPTRIAERGFINPATGEPYDNQQPLLGNIHNALENHAKKKGPSLKINPNIFEGQPQVKQYFIQYLEFTESNWNSGSVRNSKRFRDYIKDWE